MPEQANESSRRKRIVVVDDEPSIGRLAQANLEQAGYEVALAYDGREALRQILKGPTDLIVMDIGIPYADGFEIMEILNASPDTGSIPVVILSARSEESDIARGIKEGAVCYLTKPFNPAELIAFADRLLNSPR